MHVMYKKCLLDLKARGLRLSKTPAYSTLNFQLHAHFCVNCPTFPLCIACSSSGLCPEASACLGTAWAHRQQCKRK